MHQVEVDKVLEMKLFEFAFYIVKREINKLAITIRTTPTIRMVI